MKTNFIQQIITITILTASHICTSGTPLPALEPGDRDVPSSLTIDWPLVTDNTFPAEYDRKPHGEVPTKELDAAHTFLIARRDQTVDETIATTKSELDALAES
ncbi:hypothetical protein H0H93_005611, partial [Arthromyces matolae]